MSITQKCRQNPDHTFVITDDDLRFYEKVSPIFAGKKFLIPAPTLCPDCRQQRRLAFRNERKLYNRKCDLSGKQIISMYAPDKAYTVYDQPEWWSDKWDALSYGRDFDFSKTFAENLKALWLEVPLISLHTRNAENSYFTNFSLNQRNVYLVFGGVNDEDCYYGKFVHTCKDCVDNYSVLNSELCYEGVASDGCYNCKFFVNSRNCNDCLMIENCQSCKNCIGCFGLQSKEYYIFNEYVGKEKFESFKKDYEYLTHEKIDFLRKKFDALKLKFPHPQARIFGSENCSGDTLFNCKNCSYAFDAKNCEDCKYIYFTPNSNNSRDCTFNATEGVEFCYNVCSTVGVKNSMSTFFVWNCDSVFYSISCQHSNNLFACISLTRKQYCILNKQYTKEEYEKMVARIAEHMQKTGEWGDYFPYYISPFSYNETVAQEYFPITKAEALKKGSTWREEKQEATFYGEDVQIPDDIRDVNDEICNKVLKCEITGRHYKIIPQELKFYRKMKLPIPRRCPDQRNIDRLALHNPHKLWERLCAKCKQKMLTSYSPERPEIVYCQSCYLQEIY